MRKKNVPAVFMRGSWSAEGNNKCVWSIYCQENKAVKAATHDALWDCCFGKFKILLSWQKNVIVCNVTRVNSIRSKPFITSQYGYKLCVQLDVFHNVIKNRQEIFLRPVILRGGSDATIAWPFKERITFKFINHNDHQKVIILNYQPDLESASFQKPTSDTNIASAGIVFPDLQRLHQGFLKDGTLILMVKCQTSDFPAPPPGEHVLQYKCQVSEDSE